MRLAVESVESVGVSIRAMRGVDGIRQDDVPDVSHVFLRDLEKGKETVQFGRVLKVLDELGIRMVLEVTKSQAQAVEAAIHHYLPKVRSVHTRTIKKDSE
ncbi:transcriptional regulator [Curvibacter gracilis]|uniref:transcriptional regulator n=1 Tax=Curvibacter gracilis TaxID=230310 RepID=UPI0012FAE68A|nr:transcriptional regulator [Curvibacter gracilis]